MNVTKSLMKDIKSRKLKYFGRVKRHQNILKSVLEGVMEGRGQQRSVWCDNIKGWTGRSVTACSAAARNNRMEVHSHQPSDWRRHLIGIGIGKSEQVNVVGYWSVCYECVGVCVCVFACTLSFALLCSCKMFFILFWWLTRINEQWNWRHTTTKGWAVHQDGDVGGGKQRI